MAVTQLKVGSSDVAIGGAARIYAGSTLVWDPIATVQENKITEGGDNKIIESGDNKVIEGEAQGSNPGQHFTDTVAALGADLEYSNSLTTQAEIDEMSRVNSALVWSLDTGISAGAARHRFAIGEPLSRSSGYNLRKVHNEISPVQGHTRYSCQFEFYADSAWVGDRAVYAPGFNGNFKFVRIDNNDDARFHVCNWDDTGKPGTGHVCRPVMRYDGWNSTVNHTRVDDGTTLKLIENVTDLNFQAGTETKALYSEEPFDVSEHLAGAGKPFLIRADTWIRCTVEWIFQGNGRRELRIWLADETSGPVEFIGSEDDPGEGIDIRDNAVDAENAIDEFVLELNSSGAGDGATVDLDIWFRYIIIAKNQTIPLGGRPVA